MVQQLRGLVAMNENLKKQEQQFKAHCKVSKNNQPLKPHPLNQDPAPSLARRRRGVWRRPLPDWPWRKVWRVRRRGRGWLPSDKPSRQTRRNSARSKHCWYVNMGKLRGGACECGCGFALQARKNREIALLQRKIDEVPSRTELSQYQHRFIELYNQGMYCNTRL